MASGKRREHGIGPYVPQGQAGVPEFRLREARWTTIGTHKKRKDGVDLIAAAKVEAKARVAAVTTFDNVARIYIRDVGSRTWKADRQKVEFERILATYCKSILATPVADVGVGDVKRILDPWVTKRPTMVASVASVIRRVLDTAFALELRPLGVNPASEDVLSKILVVRHKTKHFASMSWQAAPTFYKSLPGSNSPQAVVAAALRLLMLTALRRNEITGLRWDEVDLDAGTLTIRAERMKAAAPHVVPLSTQAVALIRGLPGVGRGTFVFPSPRKKGQSIASTAFVPLMGPTSGATPHGMRATFRGWCEDHGVEASLAEHALAHALTDSVQKAYRRTTALELRRKLMQDWADHLTAPSAAPANV
ncbi:site-specific integrase [Mesorhizobium sp.]|uniref:tyrosine-type recombinase/integrase n=1 Tax=Mesorhizobium sp. TaxID=1871066 RepID=UPI00257C14AE|nr:site-specific integrase [Mesorhizobium sp.]